jgi:hypothetical protein
MIRCSENAKQNKAGAHACKSEAEKQKNLLKIAKVSVCSFAKAVQSKR